MPQPHVPVTPRFLTPYRMCSNCDDRMTLSVLQPGKDGQDDLTFRCKGCGHSETVTMCRA